MWDMQILTLLHAEKSVQSFHATTGQYSMGPKHLQRPVCLPAETLCAVVANHEEEAHSNGDNQRLLHAQSGN